MSISGPFDLNTFFPYQVRLFSTHVSHAIKDIYTTHYGLTSNEWRVMANLYDYRPLSAKEIVERSHTGKVNVSRAVAALQDKNLLDCHIDPTDRRRTLLCLTSKGKKIMKEIIPMMRTREQEIMSALSPQEIKTLRTLMAKIQGGSYIPPTLEDD